MQSQWLNVADFFTEVGIGSSGTRHFDTTQRGAYRLGSQGSFFHGDATGNHIAIRIQFQDGSVRVSESTRVDSVKIGACASIPEVVDVMNGVDSAGSVASRDLPQVDTIQVEGGVLDGESVSIQIGAVVCSAGFPESIERNRIEILNVNACRSTDLRGVTQHC